MSADLTPEERDPALTPEGEVLAAVIRKALPSCCDECRDDPDGAIWHDAALAAEAVTDHLAARAQAAPLTAEAIAELLAEHAWYVRGGARCSCGEQYGWISVMAQRAHRLHQAEVIARAQATATPTTAREEHDRVSGEVWEWFNRHDAPWSPSDATVSDLAWRIVEQQAAAATRADTASEALARVRTVLVDNGHADTCSTELSPDAGYPCSCWKADLRAALGGDPDHSQGRQG